jgi:gamma-glutamylcyclotransferase (GGCT)/AIG2-like uncharacterized protein YtfP
MMGLVPTPAEHLFVYGLLRPDDAPDVVRPIVRHAIDLGPATTRGLIYDLGEYPAAVPGEGVLHGRVLRWNGSVDWTMLDHWEGCDRKPPLYRRDRVTADVAKEQVEVWIYWYEPSLDDRTPLPNGHWKGGGT